MIRQFTVPEICSVTDRWTDGQTEKVTEVGAPAKKSLKWITKVQDRIIFGEIDHR